MPGCVALLSPKVVPVMGNPAPLSPPKELPGPAGLPCHNQIPSRGLWLGLGHTQQVLQRTLASAGT